GDQLRHAFLDFFVGKGHTIVPSSSLVPQGDPTLLFTNAGMVQFKDVFLGTERRPYTRATTAQKVVRAGGKHNDLDVVGRTARHHTFFEMLGNFSFGDYFKRDAIDYAWEFVTGVLGMPADRLWVTIYQDDDEAFALWREIAGVPAERIVRLGAKDNFWAMGDTGPCGPCSEIHIDRGAQLRCAAPECGVGKCDCDRWLEIWNLVFMQFNRDQAGVMTPLPRPSIDTGMGLERAASVLQNAPSNWDTDLFQPIIRRVAALSGQPYHPDERGFPHRVVGDHARACAFLIADGVVPGNEGRGYVLRRILRRAVRYGRKIGMAEGSFAQMADTVIGLMGHAYPELVTNRDFVLRVIGMEEVRFGQTLTTGLNLLDRVIDDLTGRGERVIPGEEVFKLYDTFGFPAELTQEIAEERGLEVDRAGFDQAMARQREMARAAMKFGVAAGQEATIYQPLEIPATRFVGYERLTDHSVVVGLLVEGEPVETARAGQRGELITVETPFYAESGGQIGDRGEIRGPAGRFVVEDTQRVRADLVVHRGAVAEGLLSLGDQVELAVDAARRRQIARHHTATHLLHAALRQVLGPHVQQAGSLVAPDRLRFDFTHLGPVTGEELAEIERLVNERIRDNLLVNTSVMSYAEAVATGALAFFGEKYGDLVRVLRVGPQALSTLPGGLERPFSVELCGGTHLRATGEAGFFVILGESSIGAGLRRIEAAVGAAAERVVEERLRLVSSVAHRIGAPPQEVEQRLGALLAEMETDRKRLAQLQREVLRRQVDEIVGRARRVDGVPVLAAQVNAPDVDTLREVGDWVRDRLGQGVIVLAAIIEEKPTFVTLVTPDLVARGLHAGRLARQIAQITGGGGGGRPEIAQAGGRDKSKLPEALRAVDTLVQQQGR
ncbi:MAG: alanine--tRNA ligase, partial [Chloroflexi bacterium]|nr:alanine--tRNA ligase [Chloroflexota bacterium]